MEQEQKQHILTAITHYSPTAREQLEQVLEVIMEGEGKFLAREKGKENEPYLYFTEVVENGWVLQSHQLIM